MILKRNFLFLIFNSCKIFELFILLMFLINTSFMGDPTLIILSAGRPSLIKLFDALEL